MRIALTSQNRKNITGHAGMCQNFLVYEIENGAIRSKRLIELPAEQTFHSHSGEEPHPLAGTSVLISGGMGENLKKKLVAGGIKPVVTTETDPETAVASFLAGSLVQESAHVCACDAHTHDSQTDTVHIHSSGDGCNCH